jgi:hypothetical protein
VNISCEHKISLSEILETLSPDLQVDVMDKLLYFYASKALDVRKCPNTFCGNAGIITLNNCSESLSCENCGEEWKDPVHDY